MENLLKCLNDRNLKAKFFESREDLKKEILNQIKIDDVVGIGGSMTIETLGIYDELIKRENDVVWHWKTPKEDARDALKRAIFSDVYLTSTNAIVKDGRLVNIDGVGNRVSSMFFGPKKVIIVCGINKICDDFDSALDRIKNVACPKNAKRLGLNTPCAKLGKCMDCRSDARMCNVMSVIEGKPRDIDINVYILNEEIGY